MQSESKEKEDIRQWLLLGFCILNFILCITSSCRNIYLHYMGTSPSLFCDHLAYYANIKYTLEGISLEETGNASYTWPWARILGIIVHGVFLTECESEIYACILYFIVTCLMVFTVCKKMGNIDKITKLSLLFLLLSSWYYVYLVCAFNNGSLVCILLIITISLIDDCPYLAGLTMAFAMVKAQIAAPFMLLFLLRKKWRTVGTSLGIIFGSWGIYSIITKTSPVTQLAKLFLDRTKAGSTDGFLRYGMFDFILFFDSSKAMVSLLASIVFGISIMLIIEYVVIPVDICEQYTYVSYFGASICSLLWFYTTKCDYLVLTIVALGAMEVWIKSKKSNRDLLIVIAILVCSLMNITNIMSQILAKLDIIQADMSQPLEGRFDTVLLLLLLAFICYLIKYKKWGLQNVEANID